MRFLAGWTGLRSAAVKVSRSGSWNGSPPSTGRQARHLPVRA